MFAVWRIPGITSCRFCSAFRCHFSNLAALRLHHLYPPPYLPSPTFQIWSLRTRIPMAASGDFKVLKQNAGGDSYEEALAALSSLITKRSPADKSNKGDRFELVFDYIKLLDLEEDISKMKVIHVAGTKGKGSTCTFTEFILRNYGFRTGLFTSPHLIDVRERFRLDGVDISEEKFLSYFWWCYNRLKDRTSEEIPMPTYFRFLALLAFKIFAAEEVDAAILELGLGGKFDATNAVEKPVVCGVSSLGYDHMEILGDTLGKIAGEKAGIFKHGVPAFTVLQPDEAMHVLEEKASELDVKLEVLQPLNERLLNGQKLGLDGEHQYLNACLAVSLASNSLKKIGKLEVPSLAASRLVGDSKKIRSLIHSFRDPSFVGHGCRRHPTPYFSRNIPFTTSTKKASSDDLLLQVIEREIGFAQQADDFDLVEETPSGIPFKMEDKQGTQTVILTREYDGERVKVEVHMTNLVTGEKEEDEDDNEEEENEDEEERPEKPKQSNVPLFVTLSKKTGPGLEFRCTAFPDKIVIKDMWVRFPDNPSKDEVAYEGPYFRELDEKLRKAFHRYIEIRGIKPSTINFLHEYMINKDSKEHLLWLKTIKNFVKS